MDQKQGKFKGLNIAKKKIKEIKIRSLFKKDFELLYKIQSLRKKMMRKKKKENHYSGYKKYVEGVDR